MRVLSKVKRLGRTASGQLSDKIKGGAAYMAARCGMDRVWMHSIKKKGKDVLRDGAWLRRRAQVNMESRRVFPEQITQTSLKRGRNLPVDTWMREQELMRVRDRFLFCFDTMLIVRDPYELTPLSCLLLFCTEQPCLVRYTVQGKSPECNFTYKTGRYETKHRVPVFGLYASFENEVDLELLDKSGGVIAQRRIRIPVRRVLDNVGHKVDPVVRRGNTAMPFVFVTGGYKSRTYAFDRNGDIRYLLTKTPRQYGVYPMINGRFLFSDREINRPTFNNPHAIIMYDMDYMGRVKETYYVAEGIHHWAAAVPGTGGRQVLGATSSLEEQRMEGTLLRFDCESGTVVGMYNLGNYFPEQLQDKYDWAHLNRIYCQDGRYVILSLRNVHTVVKFDIEEEKIMWVLSHPDLYKGTILEDKVLRPCGDNFHYFLQQHAVEMVDTGLSDKRKHVLEVTLFDNHCNTKHKVSWFDEKIESYVCFYRIDEKEFTVETTQVIPCAMSPTRSNVWFDKDMRRVFGMAGAACSNGENEKALIYEWDFHTAEEVSRYELSDGFFKAYPFETQGGDLEEFLQIGPQYRKGHLEKPARCDVSMRALKRMDSKIRKQLHFYCMDDLVCVRAKDHKIQKIYFQGGETWVRDFTDTVQKTEVFANKVYCVAATTEYLPAGRYKLIICYDGELYDTREWFVVG